MKNWALTQMLNLDGVWHLKRCWGCRNSGHSRRRKFKMGHSRVRWWWKGTGVETRRILRLHKHWNWDTVWSRYVGNLRTSLSGKLLDLLLVHGDWLSIRLLYILSPGCEFGKRVVV